MKNIFRNIQFVNQQAEEKRWQKIYKRGKETANKFKITLEEDIDRILE